MAFAAAALPYLSAAGAAYGAVKSANAATYNAGVMKNEQGAAAAQALQQSNMVQREGRQALGKQLAAFGGAGVGYGGSSQIALDQTAVNSELDALNTRYKGAITGYGYGAQAGLDKSAASSDEVSGGLLAGAALLKGAGPTYTFMSNSTPAAMAGTSNYNSAPLA